MVVTRTVRESVSPADYRNLTFVAHESALPGYLEELRQPEVIEQVSDDDRVID
ncbi:hypothetical protein ACIGO9_31170 [Nocardia asteroides]|uniref:hypothetical protein n=1 Tax=Nocardia asteroides TaxID=1824 RepID=UPI0037C75E89